MNFVIASYIHTHLLLLLRLLFSPIALDFSIFWKYEILYIIIIIKPNTPQPTMSINPYRFWLYNSFQTEIYSFLLSQLIYVLYIQSRVTNMLYEMDWFYLDFQTLHMNTHNIDAIIMGVIIKYKCNSL